MTFERQERVSTASPVDVEEFGGAAPEDIENVLRLYQLEQPPLGHASRHPEQPLRSNQRELTWQHPPALIAALNSQLSAAVGPFRAVYVDVHKPSNGRQIPGLTTSVQCNAAGRVWLHSSSSTQARHLHD